MKLPCNKDQYSVTSVSIPIIRFSQCRSLLDNIQWFIASEM